jgi:hypothetical protein
LLLLAAIEAVVTNASIRVRAGLAVGVIIVVALEGLLLLLAKHLFADHLAHFIGGSVCSAGLLGFHSSRSVFPIKAAVHNDPPKNIENRKSAKRSGRNSVRGRRSSSGSFFVFEIVSLRHLTHLAL